MIRQALLAESGCLGVFTTNIERFFEILKANGILQQGNLVASWLQVGCKFLL
jgi:hypothetical protein